MSIRVYSETISLCALSIKKGGIDETITSTHPLIQLYVEANNLNNGEQLARKVQVYIRTQAEQSDSLVTKDRLTLATFISLVRGYRDTLRSTLVESIQASQATADETSENDQELIEWSDWLMEVYQKMTVFLDNIATHMKLGCVHDDYLCLTQE